MKIIIVFLLLLFSVIPIMTYDARAVEVWHNIKEYSDRADFAIYNDTGASIHVTGNDDWGHKGILGDINPYSSKMDGNIKIKEGSENQGTLYFELTTPEGDKSSINIWAHTQLGTNWYTLHKSGDDWTTAQGEESPSGALAIPDKDMYVTQIWNKYFVVTLFTCQNDDSAKFESTGNTKIILLINKNDPQRFTGETDRKVDRDWPPNWID